MMSSSLQDRLFVARYLSEVARLMETDGGLRGFEPFTLRHDTERVVDLASAVALKGPLAVPVLTAHRLILAAMKGQPEISEPPMKSAHELYQDSLIRFIDKAELNNKSCTSALYSDVLRQAFETKPTAALAHRLLRHGPTSARGSSFLSHEINRCLEAESFDERLQMFQVAPSPKDITQMALSPVVHARVAFHYAGLASEFLKLGQGRDFCTAVRAMRAFAVIGLEGPYSEDRDNLFGLTRQSDIYLMKRYVNDDFDAALSVAERADGLRLLIELNDPVYAPAAAKKAATLFQLNDLKNETNAALLPLAVTALTIYPAEEAFYSGLLRLAERFACMAQPDAALFALEAALKHKGDSGASQAVMMKEILTNPLGADAELPYGGGLLSAAQFNEKARRVGGPLRPHSAPSLNVPACG